MSKKVIVMNPAPSRELSARSAAMQSYVKQVRAVRPAEKFPTPKQVCRAIEILTEFFREEEGGSGLIGTLTSKPEVTWPAKLFSVRPTVSH